MALELDDLIFELTPEDIQVEREIRAGLVAANQDLLTIALDTQLDAALISEGLAREIVNKINTMRRDAGFNVSDRIQVQVEGPQAVIDAFSKHEEYITNEVLATSVTFGPIDQGQEWDLNGHLTKLKLTKQ